MDASDRKRKRAAEYYQRNKEKIVERACMWQRDNKESKNANNRKWRTENPDKQWAAVKNWRSCNWESNMLYGARERSKANNLECTITVDDIIVPERCPVFGVLLERGSGRWQDNSPTLDRIDNTKGYVPGNIVVVSWLANRLKSNATIDQLKAIVSFYEAQAEKIPPSRL